MELYRCEIWTTPWPIVSFGGIIDLEPNGFPNVPTQTVLLSFTETFPKEVADNLKSLQESLNLEGTDEINWKEFIALTMDRSLAIRQDKVQLAFDHFKRSDSRNIQLEDLVTLLGGEGQAREIMGFVDADGDGKITFDEFFAAIKEGIEGEEDLPMDTSF
jgi:Ca2+-binding EF-hand superfamily protein